MNKSAKAKIRRRTIMVIESEINDLLEQLAQQRKTQCYPPISDRARYPAGLSNFRPNDRGGSRISRRAVIYCRIGTAREERAVVGRLRTVATKQGWTVIKAFVDTLGGFRISLPLDEEVQNMSTARRRRREPKGRGR